MTQIFRVEANGEDITDSIVGNTSISLQTSRFYNVATITVANVTIANNIIGKDIQIFYGNETFTGIAFSVNKVSYNSFAIEVRSSGIQLTEPFVQHDVSIDNANTAIALCALYASNSGVPISWLCEDLDFGGSYERNGTYITALKTLATTIGAEYYDTQGGIVIEPNKLIGPISDFNLTSNDYFDFAEQGITLYNKGVGIVKTTDGAFTSDDIIDDNKINIDVFDDGAAHVYTIPNGVLSGTKGITVKSEVKQKEIVENITILDGQQIQLKAAIKDVISVSLNGNIISNYNFSDGHGVLYFTYPITGYLTVTYTGYYYEGSPEYTETPNGSFASITLDYLNQRLSHYWYIKTDAISDDYTEEVITEDELNISKGFCAWVSPDMAPKVELFSDGGLFKTITTTVDDVYMDTISAHLVAVGDGTYTYTMSADKTVEMVTSFGNGIAYTQAIIGEDRILTFDRYYGSVEITYSKTMQKFCVPPTIIDGEIYMSIADLNTGQHYDYDIDNINSNDIDTIPCALNQDIPIDFVSELYLKLAEVSGKSIPMTTPSGGEQTITIGANGIYKVHVTENGDYIFNVSSLVNRTDATLTLTMSV